MRYVNDLPDFMLKLSSDIKEIDIFSLPDITNKRDNNLWEKVLNIKLSKIFKLKIEKLKFNLISYNHRDFSIRIENITINNSNLISFLIDYLNNNESILIYTNFFNRPLGYLIISGEKKYM